MTTQFEMRLCQNPTCGLRYPLVTGHPFGERCPRCLGITVVVRTQTLDPEPFAPLNRPRLPLEALLDNLRSAWNVGAIFRTADGLGVRKIHLCGITPTPEHPSVAKTALGATQTIPWTSSPNALTQAKSLKAAGARLWALELDERAELVTAPWEATSAPVVLIVGNEVTGVDPALLDLCERIVYLPMQGQKRSFNVEVAFGIGVFALQQACCAD
jgi:23S rRNA (guanosine2251-2'-O)-methyltransferase